MYSISSALKLYMACIMRLADSPEAPLLPISSFAFEISAYLRCTSVSSSVGTEILALPRPIPRTS